MNQLSIKRRTNRLQASANHRPLNDISNQVNGSNMTNQPLNHDDFRLDEKRLETLQAQAKLDTHIRKSFENHILPVVPNGSSKVTHSISAQTLVDVLNGQYKDKIKECIIIDSRYPYEYEGGHIKGAINLYTIDMLVREMFVKRLNLCRSISQTSCCNKRAIVIIHCEFSQKRGPSMLNAMRAFDRNLDWNSYPNVYYPELYLLIGGYKNFYLKNTRFCIREMYKPMIHEEHEDELRKHKKEADSWVEIYKPYCK